MKKLLQLAEDVFPAEMLDNDVKILPQGVSLNEGQVLERIEQRYKS